MPAIPGLQILHWVSIITPIVAVLGTGGMIALMVFAPAVYVVVLKAIKDTLKLLLATRLGCIALTLVMAVPLAYWGGTFEQDRVEAVRQANAAAALAHKLADAARLAAANDQARAEAAAAAAQQQQERADALAKQIAEKPCLDPADTDRLRKLWDRPGGAAKRRSSRAPRRIEDLLGRG